MTAKAGQKCTAIRRIIAPSNIAGDVVRALSTSLGEIRIGNPGIKDVDMGALASQGQLRKYAIELLNYRPRPRSCLVAMMISISSMPMRARVRFFMPTLLHCDKPLSSSAVHSVEAFGPVSTVLPYDSLDEAIELARLGEGSLAGSIVTNDNDVARDLVLGTAAYHGRMVIINRHCAAESTGHGSPLAHLVHGGPGRAGGGEEMGGVRGVLHYMQRTAIQGSPEDAVAYWSIAGIRGADEKDPGVHPFRKTFEQIELGDTFKSEERAVTLDDIDHFAEFTGDNFLHT